MFAIVSNRRTGRQDRGRWGATLVAVAEGRVGSVGRSRGDGGHGVGMDGNLDGNSDRHGRNQPNARQYPVFRHSCLGESDRHGPRVRHHLSQTGVKLAHLPSGARDGDASGRRACWLGTASTVVNRFGLAVSEEGGANVRMRGYRKATSAPKAAPERIPSRMQRGTPMRETDACLLDVE